MANFARARCSALNGARRGGVQGLHEYLRVRRRGCWRGRSTSEGHPEAILRQYDKWPSPIT